jgi:predicted phage tail protein
VVANSAATAATSATSTRLNAFIFSLAVSMVIPTVTEMIAVDARRPFARPCAQ